MWLAPAVPSVAHELGEVDARDGVAGTAQDADTAQLPQSTSPVVGVVEAGRLGLRQASPTAGPSRPCARRCRRSSPSGRCRGGTTVAVVSILKWTVCPWLTLMSVAKPWIVGVAGAADVPLARRVAGLACSRRRSGLDRRIARGGSGSGGAHPQTNHQEHEQSERKREHDPPRPRCYRGLWGSGINAARFSRRSTPDGSQCSATQPSIPPNAYHLHPA